MDKIYIFYEKKIVAEASINSELIYQLKYEKSWLDDPKSFPLSFALPLSEKTYGNKLTLSFLENLLPEGDVRTSLPYGSNPIRFLDEFGADCAGAFTTSSKNIYTEPNLTGNDYKEITLDSVYEALETRSLAQAVSELHPGYLSLAGAQDKIAATVIGHKIYTPLKHQPTTHIIKPPIKKKHVYHTVYNELFCMRLADRIGLTVPNCYVIPGKYPLLVIERYDRTKKKDGVHRLHQQDFCQAQGLTSLSKYQNEGGPSFADNYKFLVNHVAIKYRSKDQFRLLDWLAFNLLIGNCDSHSKNISLINVPEGVRLAPFYDLLTTLIYKSLPKEFAFVIGECENIFEISKKNIEMLEEELGLKKGMIVKKIDHIALRISLEKNRLIEKLQQEYGQIAIFNELSRFIDSRIKCLAKYGVVSNQTLEAKPKKFEKKIDAKKIICSNPECKNKVIERNNSNPLRIQAGLCSKHFHKA